MPDVALADRAPPTSTMVCGIESSQGLGAPTRAYLTAACSTNREHDLRRRGSRQRHTSLLRLLLGDIADGEEKAKKRKVLAAMEGCASTPQPSCRCSATTTMANAIGAEQGREGTEMQMAWVRASIRQLGGYVPPKSQDDRWMETDGRDRPAPHRA